MFGTDAFYSEPAGPLGPALVSEYPEIESAIRINSRSVILRSGETVFNEDVLYADPDFFEFFNFSLISGDPGTILNEPKAAVITESLSEKYFGNEDPVGKSITIRDNNSINDYIIRGVAGDPPGNSSIRFNLVINFTPGYKSTLENWNSMAAATYIRLDSPAGIEGLDRKIEELVKRNSTKTYSSNIKWTLSSLVDHHLDPESVALSMSPPSDIRYSYILAAIAAFILLIACFNFMNLSIGGASARLKEIGMRKVMGALEKQLKNQFWFESAILVFLALILGINLAALLLSGFNSYTMKELEIRALFEFKTILFIAVLLVTTGAIAGSYPSIVFSKFSINEMFRKRLRLGGKNLFTRLLILIQFGLSIFLVISTVTMQGQRGFINNRDLGFNDTDLLSLRLVSEPGDGSANKRIFEQLKNEFSGTPDVLSVSASSASLMQEHRSGLPYSFGNGDYTLISIFFVDQNLLDDLEFSFIEKRSINDELINTSGNTVFVNEAFCRIFEVESPVGRTIKEVLPNLRNQVGGENPVIAGVLKDFHFSSLRYKITPLMVFNHLDEVNYVFFRLKNSYSSELLDRIKLQYSEIAPDNPFMYSFVDDDLSAIHVDDERWGNIISISASFAIFIACLGLFGLTLLTAAGKTKEIGIRKVLGASVSGIISIVNREFIILIIAANIFAWPAAYYAMNKWLDNFAYRIELSLLIFLTGAVTAFLIGLLTVSIQAFRASRMNPVDTIRYE